MQALAFSAHQKEDKREEVFYQIVAPFHNAFFFHRYAHIKQF